MTYQDWLWESPSGKFVRWALQLFAPIFAVGATLWVIHEAERRALPVVTEWSLDYISREGDQFLMGGRIYKARKCELINTAVIGVPKNPLLPRVTVYQVDPNELLGADIPAGYHTWGPWSVKIPATLHQYKNQIAGLEVVGRHRCHGLWVQETVYGFVPMSRVPL